MGKVYVPPQEPYSPLQSVFVSILLISNACWYSQIRDFHFEFVMWGISNSNNLPFMNRRFLSGYRNDSVTFWESHEMVRSFIFISAKVLWRNCIRKRLRDYFKGASLKIMLSWRVALMLNNFLILDIKSLVVTTPGRLNKMLSFLLPWNINYCWNGVHQNKKNTFFAV